MWNAPNARFHGLRLRAPITVCNAGGATHLSNAPAGSALPVELTWDGPLDGTRHYSLRLIAADGTPVAQVDDGLDTVNRIQLFVPPDAAPRNYGLHLKLYYAATQEPIPAADGAQIVVVAEVEVGE